MPSSRNHRGKLLRISSEDKSEGQTNANFTVNLGNSAFVQAVKSIAIKSVSFKHVFPNIFNGNNTIRYEYNGTPSGFTIAEGWYNASELVDALNIGFASDSNITGSLVISLEPAPTALYSKFRFTSDLITKIFNKDDGNPMADVLGVSQTLESTISEAQNLPDLGGLSVIYLCSNILASSNSAASSNQGEIVPVVCEIPINVPFGGEVLYRAIDGDLETVMYQNVKQFTEVDLRLCTRAGDILDLQQNNLTIMVRIVPMGSYATD